MKKLLTLLFLLTISLHAFADIGPAGRSVSIDATGALQEGSLENWFVYVKNNGASAASDGSLVVFDTASDDGYTFSTSTTAGDSPVCMLDSNRDASCAAEAICRCRTYGYTDKLLFDSTNRTASAGHQFFISENVAGYAQAEDLASVAASDVPGGVFYDDASASAAVEAFVRLR